MPSSYPNVVDAWTNPSSGTLMNAPGFEHDIAHANVYDALEKIEAELGTNPSGPALTVRERLESMSFNRTPFLTVGSASLPTVYKEACDYTCSGSADQAQINDALRRASRINDGFSTAEGWAAVVLVGDRFSVNSPITMYPNTKLMGGGDGTLIESAYPSGDLRGIIELRNTLVSRCTVSDMSIGSPDGNPFNGSGIKFDMTGDPGDSYDFPTGGDAFIKIRRVGVYNPMQRGIWLIDGREAQIDNIHVQNARKQGLFVDDHSDVKITRVVANGNAGTEAGIEITGGNGQITDSKVFYRGNKDGSTPTPTGSPQHGFKINTSRMTIGDCQAQDNGGYGFYIQGADHSVSNCMAESNSAQDPGYGGFFIAASGSYSGITAYVRANNYLYQNRGVVFSGSPQVYMTGRVDVQSGSNHVVGSPGANSYVRLVRGGATLHSVGQ